jgi:nucleoside-diphosphate-sugar epimerase
MHMKSKLKKRLTHNEWLPAHHYRLNRQTAPSARPTLLIVGCGDVGLRLVKWLRANHPANRLRILATHRTPGKEAEIRNAGAIPILLDLDKPSSVSAKRLSGIAHWMINLSPPPNDSAGTDPRSKRLLQALEGTRSPRWVYISTSGVYGDCQGAWVDEARPVAAKSARGARRVDGERIHRANGASVLRAPGIYGHDRLPIDRLKAGTPALREEDDTFTNHIHALDLAIMSWLAVFRGSAKRVFNASDDSHMKMGDYFDAVATAFDLPKPPRLPRAEVAKAVSPMMLTFMSESRRLKNNRMKIELRMRLRYPTVTSTLMSLEDFQ